MPLINVTCCCSKPDLDFHMRYTDSMLCEGVLCRYVEMDLFLREAFVRWITFEYRLSPIYSPIPCMWKQTWIEPEKAPWVTLSVILLDYCKLYGIVLLCFLQQFGHPIKSKYCKKAEMRTRASCITTLLALFEFVIFWYFWRSPPSNSTIWCIG